MTILKLFAFLTLTTFSAFSFAYGSSTGGQKSCSKPKLSHFMPAHLSEVKPQSTFSFRASLATVPSSITVSAKKIPVAVSVNKTPNGYNVSGTLPPNLSDTYARINIQAMSTNRCPGGDGWLLKILGKTP